MGEQEGQGQLPGHGSLATDKQIKLIKRLVEDKRSAIESNTPKALLPFLQKKMSELTKSEASDMIKMLKDDLPVKAELTKSISPKAIIIPALGKTIAELGLVPDIDYYERGGIFRLLKEGLQKVAASSTMRVCMQIKELKCEPNEYEPVQIYLKMRGWVAGEEGNTVWETEEQTNWSYKLETERTILKKISFSGRNSSGKDITRNDVEMNDGTLQLKEDKALDLRSFMIDQQKYALRKVVGEVKRRIWGEWLGVTTVSKSELEQELEEAERVDEEE